MILWGQLCEHVLPSVAFKQFPAACCALQALLKLCRFRNRHPAFTGLVFVDDATPPHELHVRWYSGSKHMAVLWADLQTLEFSISHTPYQEDEAAAQGVKDASTSAAAADAALDAAAPNAAAGAIAAAFSASFGEGTAAAAGVSSQDLASVFNIDALDEETRAAVRRQMVDAALQEMDSSCIRDKVQSAGSAAAAEELFNEVLGSANSVDFLEARKDARRLPASAAAIGQTDGQQEAQKQNGAAAGNNGNNSNSNGSSNGNGGDARAGSNGQIVGSSSRGSSGRVAKRTRVPVAAGVSSGAGQLWAAGGGDDRYNGYNTSASESETDEGSASDVEEPEIDAAPAADAAAASDVAAGDAVEAVGGAKAAGNGNGNGNGRSKHGVLQQLDLSYGWRQPDERCEAATGG